MTGSLRMQKTNTIKDPGRFIITPDWRILGERQISLRRCTCDQRNAD